MRGQYNPPHREARQLERIMTDPDRLARRAAALDRALLDATPIAQSAAADVLSFAEAYAVQGQVCALRLARGDRRVGIKQGFTSGVMRAKLNIPHPALGTLHASMEVADGGVFSLAGHIAPRLEVEVVFCLRTALPAGATRAMARAAVAAVAPGIEIIDGRYRDFKFAVTDVVADNTSACGFAVGAWRSDVPELGDLAVTLERDGAPLARGDTAVILGHPLDALCHAATLAAELGLPLGAGDIVFAGSAIDPVPVGGPGRIQGRIAGLGEVGFTVR